MARVKEFSKEEVLNKAIEIFWLYGYKNTSAKDLVEGLGISRSSIYDTYGDKRTLFITALKEYRRRVAGGLIEFTSHSTNAALTIKQILKSIVSDSLQDKIPRGCFLVNSAIELAPHDSEIADIVNGNLRDIEEALYRTIKMGQEEGKFSKKHSARSLARFLYNSISGIRVAAKSGVDKKIYDDVTRVTLSVLYK